MDLAKKLAALYAQRDDLIVRRDQVDEESDNRPPRLTNEPDLRDRTLNRLHWEIDFVEQQIYAILGNPALARETP